MRGRMPARFTAPWTWAGRNSWGRLLRRTASRDPAWWTRMVARRRLCCSHLRREGASLEISVAALRELAIASPLRPTISIDTPRQKVLRWFDAHGHPWFQYLRAWGAAAPYPLAPLAAARTRRVSDLRNSGPPSTGPIVAVMGVNPDHVPIV